MGFEVWKELSDGKIHLASWPLCEVFLVDEALYPGWLVLVPRRENATELPDLTADDQVLLIQEVSWASRLVRKAVSPDKINVGALGNVVAQLHLHVVPRFTSDKAWPGPVWGIYPCQKFDTGDLSATVSMIKAASEDLEANFTEFTAFSIKGITSQNAICMNTER